MSQYLSNLRKHTNNALREFSAHPINYTYSAAKEFVKDYWDLGAVILAGFAFCDTNSEVLGSARPYLMVAGPIAGMIGGGQQELPDRFARNTLAGFASLSVFWTRGTDAPLTAELGNYAAANLLGTGALYMDICREKSKKAENSQPQNIGGSLDLVLE